MALISGVFSRLQSVAAVRPAYRESRQLLSPIVIVKSCLVSGVALIRVTAQIDKKIVFLNIDAALLRLPSNFA